MKTTQIEYSSDIVSLYKDVFSVEGDYGPRAIVLPFLETWLHRCFPLPSGDPAARNILDSRSKKQGKSSVAALVALYLASRARYAEIVIAAADLDQSKDRVLRAVKFAVENHPAWRGAKVYKDIIELDNGSTIQALPQDWRGASGGNYSGCIFDELHGYTLEGMRRLYDELVVPPTIKAGCRWIASYAGYSGESKLLEEVWALALRGERDPGELPIYENKSASLIALIDQGEESWRMPWTTPQYMKEVQASERPSVYRRLWLNQWVSSESAFLPEGAWEACRNPEVRPLAPKDKRRVMFGADASTSKDLTALVGVTYDEITDTADVVFCRVWKPQRGIFRMGKPTIDLEATIGEEILNLHKSGNVAGVVYDPYQFHSLAISLEREGVPMIELPQTGQRVQADQALYDGIISRSIRHFGDPTLTEHIHNAVAIESTRGWRLSKERTSAKIDACVALSMAYYGAIERLKGSGGISSMPNIFYDYSKPDGSIGDIDEWIHIRNQWMYAPNRKRHHSRGATSWRDCRYRTRGCLDCIAEMEAEGVYQMQDEEVENVIPLSEEEARKQFLDNSGLGYTLKQNELEAQNEQKFLSKFRKAVYKRLARGSRGDKSQ